MLEISKHVFNVPKWVKNKRSKVLVIFELEKIDWRIIKKINKDENEYL